MKMMKSNIKVLFIHNAVPEYRIEFWKNLGEKVDLQLLITRRGLEDKIYGLDKNTNGLKIAYWNKGWIDKIIKYDVVIVPPIESVYEWKIAYKVVSLCKKRNIPCVYWNERWEWSEKKDLSAKRRLSYLAHRKLIKSVCKKTKRMIASGSKARDYLKLLDLKNIDIAYDSSTSPVNSQLIDFEKVYGIDRNDKVILFLGRIIKRKGLYHLLEAYKLQKEDYKLIVCGKGEDKERCVQYAKENHLDNVIFTGIVQPNLRGEYLKRATVFVLPSYLGEDCSVEAWGLTVNEALEQGTPVIVSDVCGVAYDLADGKQCIMVKNGDTMELARALKKMLENEKNEEACKGLYRKYSVSGMVDSFANTIESVIQ